MMNSSYAEESQKMRRLHRRLLFALLIGPVSLGINHYFINPTNRAAPGVVAFCAVWLLFGVWTAFKYQTMPCPRCTRPWRGSWFSLSGVGPWSVLRLPQRCPHCGLDKDQIDFKSQIKKLYARASSTILNGVSAARRTRENPAAFNIFESRPSPA
jgi:hypothetical protein